MLSVAPAPVIFRHTDATETTFPSDIEACHRLLREQSGVITECRKTIAERDTALAAKDALVAQQNQQLAEQKDKIAEYSSASPLRSRPTSGSRSSRSRPTPPG